MEYSYGQLATVLTMPSVHHYWHRLHTELNHKHLIVVPTHNYSNLL